ncbi:MAG: Asp-tRNA(Asn)/Glu-tRNA(Gln) amidotransferase subunit GatC [Lachnospiraceae bacterium]|nr:Asp-tRNA(Asn)/Glu-tRNA(Gln) amidotransferase subunit GatC [Lachnospiraceae bacterium]
MEQEKKEIMTRERIKRVARLAELNLSPDEEVRFQQDVQRMLEYVDCLNTLDTDGVEPLYQVIEDNPVMREDMPESVYGREELLSGAPSERGGYFAVPRSFQ